MDTRTASPGDFPPPYLLNKIQRSCRRVRCALRSLLQWRGHAVTGITTVNCRLCDAITASLASYDRRKALHRRCGGGGAKQTRWLMVYRSSSSSSNHPSSPCSPPDVRSAPPARYSRCSGQRRMGQGPIRPWMGSRCPPLRPGGWVHLARPRTAFECGRCSRCNPSSWKRRTLNIATVTSQHHNKRVHHALYDGRASGTAWIVILSN